MNLTQKQFEKLLNNKKLVISLIGMSNVGKTFWSRKLSLLEFEHINCDDLIELELFSKLKLKSSECGGIGNIARWMGQPYENRFLSNQEKYLQCEINIMKNIFTDLSKKNRNFSNVVIDTTGSVVHTGNDICASLKKFSLVVYIKCSKNMKKQMFLNYIKKPKPVVWNNIFQLNNNETKDKALKRCYRKLFDLREKLYEKYADVVVPINYLYKNIDASQFLSQIKKIL